MDFGEITVEANSSDEARTIAVERAVEKPWEVEVLDGGGVAYDYNVEEVVKDSLDDRHDS
ncbi:MAG: hypothetical protein KY455_08520 [Euryarchaeota archaeon]|nr:hypothetical protein [Euryarchaeota archaeon]